MMGDEVISQLLDFGALGIFAGFLIRQHLGMQRRLDKLVDGFQDQLKEIDSGYERRIEIMRERYDKVIDSIRRDCREKEERLTAEKNALQSQLLQRERESVLNIRMKDQT